MMDLFGAQLSYHEAHEGHEERTTGLEKATGFQHDFLFLRALRVLRGGILRCQCPIWDKALTV